MKTTCFGRILAVCAAVASAFSPAFADVIVKADGSSMNVHNVDVSSKFVFYTLTPDDENIKRIPIGEVFAYKIGDGPLTPVGQQTAQKAETKPAAEEQSETAFKEIAPAPSADNARLISLYNNQGPLVYKGKKPQPDKKTGYFISIWGMEEGSVLSDSILEIGFEHVYLDNDKARSIVGQRLKITNKTSRPVYIDLANSFRKMNGGYSDPYFKGAVFNEGASATSGGSMNMGAVAGALGIGGALGTLASGLNLGQSNTKNAGITTAEQQYLVVPANSSITMPGRKVANGKKIMETYEPIYIRQKKLSDTQENYALKYEDEVTLTVSEDQKVQRVQDNQEVTRESLDIKRWLQTDYTPEESPKKLGWLITYSAEPDFSRYTRLPVNMYMRGAFGLNVNGSYYFYFNSESYEPVENPEYIITGGGMIGKE